MVTATLYDQISTLCRDADFRLPVNIPKILSPSDTRLYGPQHWTTQRELLLETLSSADACLQESRRLASPGQEGPASANRAPKAAPDGTRSVPSLVSSGSIPAWASASTAALRSASSTVTSNGPSPSLSSARRTGPSPLGERRSMVKPRISKVTRFAARPALSSLRPGSALNRVEYSPTASSRSCTATATPVTALAPLRCSPTPSTERRSWSGSSHWMKNGHRRRQGTSTGTSRRQVSALPSGLSRLISKGPTISSPASRMPAASASISSVLVPPAELTPGWTGGRAAPRP